VPTALSSAISSTQSLLRTCRARSRWLDVSRSLRLESRGVATPRNERDVCVGPADSLFCAHRMGQRASCPQRKLFARWLASRAHVTTEARNTRAAVKLLRACAARWLGRRVSCNRSRSPQRIRRRSPLRARRARARPRGRPDPISSWWGSRAEPVHMAQRARTQVKARIRPRADRGEGKSDSRPRTLVVIQPPRSRQIGHTLWSVSAVSPGLLPWR
jgi:hypothetical protein